MFVDYYAVLETPLDSSAEDIKKAYRRMAQRWHPDRNPGADTVSRMQEINEAYLLLNDPEARARYDTEYLRYQQFRASRASQARPRPEPPGSPPGPPPERQEYHFADETLLRWMQNARRQAAELSRQTKEEFLKGAGAAAEEMGQRLVSYGVIGMVFLVIFAASKGCG
jgi:curved DNA-binding protein CbpA